MPSEQDFQTLLAAARLGADWAWTVIYRDYSSAVLRYLKGQGAPDPEDLLGEVFLQMVRNLGAFEGTERGFRTWVFMIAHNRLVDGRRRAARGRLDHVPHDELAVAAGSGDCEDDAMSRVDYEAVVTILKRLTPSQRDVLFLRLLARLTVEEVAAVVGKRPGAVKALQARGLATVRREMSKRP